VNSSVIIMSTVTKKRLKCGSESGGVKRDVVGKEVGRERSVLGLDGQNGCSAFCM
jgi:hypothetical protein